MAYQDSIGCKDTITKLNFITIVGTKAVIDTLPDQYYCAPQIVLFNSSSFVYDSLPFRSPSVYDTIARYQWIFGDNTPESGLEDPAHNYTRNGVFDVRMVAISGAGCSDTDYAQVKINGPIPSFTINDTLGCVPFTVILSNTTGKPLKSWTWYYGDSANQTFTTLNDNSVTFTYTKPGIYAIRLLGSQDVTNPTTGNTVNCNSFFPDPATNFPVRKVYVKPPLPVSITSVDSVCAHSGFLLMANADSTYTKFVWRISNGDSIHLNRPDSVSTYRFDSTGFFTINLFPVENPTSQCWDSATTTINVVSVSADFEIDSSKSPVYTFHNTSSGSTLYRWDFGKPSAGATNESNAVNGEFDFGRDTATYSVCLFVLNTLDCWDSVCKPVQIKQMRLIIPNVFTPGNGDGYNDAFDIDILGFTEYHLLIYNRWGTMVYESMQDGYQNDGINWNGNDHQTGPPCSDGTYYYVFTYKMYTESASKSAHGTITLIRNK
jgi:gliding motility-associated-like protein